MAEFSASGELGSIKVAEFSEAGNSKIGELEAGNSKRRTRYIPISKIGDVILFLKSEKEFDKQYQYGMISDVLKTRDGRIRKLEIEYMNHNEKVRRKTTRASRDVVVIHPVGQLGLIRDLNKISESCIE